MYKGITISQRYTDETEREAMPNEYNVFKGERYVGRIFRRNIDGRYQWGSMWDTEHAATLEEAAEQRARHYPA